MSKSTMLTFDPMTFRHFISIISLTMILSGGVVLSGCATSPKKTDGAHELKTAKKQKPTSLSKRVLKGTASTTLWAAKGAAKGAANLTVDGAQMAAKATAKGVKAGGDVIIGTGKIVAKGTRSTAKGVGQGMDLIFTAPAAKDAANPVGHKTLTDAALSPLSDFNLRKRERPEVLMRLEAENIYHISDRTDCNVLALRIAELDDVLGDDYDVKETSSSTLDKAGKAGKGAAISKVASTAGTFIPGRGIVRAVSGASARQKQTREIYQKGVARRSYIKGLASSQGCEEF